MDTPEKPTVQLKAHETERIATGTCETCDIRLVLRRSLPPALVGSEGDVFPDLETAADYLYKTFRQRCLSRGGLPHSDWIPPSPASADAPATLGIEEPFDTTEDHGRVTYTAPHPFNWRIADLGPDWRAVPLWALKEAVAGLEDGRTIKRIGLINLLQEIVDGREVDSGMFVKAQVKIEAKEAAEVRADDILWNARDRIVELVRRLRVLGYADEPAFVDVVSRADQFLQGIMQPAKPDRMPDALGLIADLAALLQADNYPVAMGSKVLQRADAMLKGEDLSKLPKVTVIDRDGEQPLVDDDQWATVQELLNAIGDIPGMGDLVDAYMRGRGIDDPREAIAKLRKVAF